jgi:hypothetical protein
MTPEGVGEVLDFMPVEDPQQATDRHRLVRVVRCVRGEIRFVFECAPRFDYGRQEHQLELTDEGAVFRTPTLQLTLHGGGAGAMQRHGNDVRGALTVRAGQTGGVMLESAADGPTPDHDPRGACWPCSPPRRGSGGAGWPAPATGAAGARWSTARRSP